MIHSFSKLRNFRYFIILFFIYNQSIEILQKTSLIIKEQSLQSFLFSKRFNKQKYKILLIEHLNFNKINLHNIKPLFIKSTSNDIFYRFLFNIHIKNTRNSNILCNPFRNLIFLYSRRSSIDVTHNLTVKTLLKHLWNAICFGNALS